MECVCLSVVVESTASVTPQLVLFRNRINSVIDEATELLKANVKGTMYV